MSCYYQLVDIYFLFYLFLYPTYCLNENNIADDINITMWPYKENQKLNKL